MAQQTKQKVTIKITFDYDQLSRQEEYDRLINEGGKDNKELARKINNDDIMLLHVNVEADVINPSCGHIETFFDSLGSCYYNPQREDITEITAFTYYKMVDNVKDQIIDKFGDNFEFNIEYDKEIKYNGVW
jgi:hypothetical protein